MKPLNLSKVSKDEVTRYFLQTWLLDESLYQGVSDKALYIKYQPLRHPLIFYMGHTAVVMLNKMNLKGMAPRVKPQFQAMFAVGVDEMDWDDLNSQHYNWPTRAEVMAYRNQVKTIVLDYIKDKFVEGTVGWTDESWIIVLGIQHLKIHVETSSVLIRTVQISQVTPQPRFPVCPTYRKDPKTVPVNELLPVEGINRDWPKQLKGTKAYGWDNQFGKHHFQCKKFKASKYLVSNAQFLQFVLQDGYHKPEYWQQEGKQWLKCRRKDHPIFWVQTGQTYRYRTIFAEMEMPWDWPVDVNYHQAKAFCNWKNLTQGTKLRLPNQDEWYALRDLYPKDIFDWQPNKAGNINLEHFASACPVDMFQHAAGFYDIVGNVWQWNQTPIYGFEGYQVHPLYEDFSSPTFDQRHNLIFGGSFISQGNLAMKEARYAFRKHFYQHAGFRYVESNQSARKQPLKEYETDELANNYLQFHFGTERYFGVENFPKACIEACFVLNEKHGIGWGKAADLGCAVGRSTFQLARRFDKVDGIDLSVRFFQLGIKLMEKKELHYKIATEGSLFQKKTIKLSQLGLQPYKHKADFKQQDATILDINRFNSYDLVFCGNLIDRMARPKIFLQNIHKYINKGGLLVITSPYTWLPNWTSPSEWVGGYEDQSGPVTTLEGLRRALSPKFDLIGEPFDIPFVIRETARKYQHTLANVTCWKLSR